VVMLKCEDVLDVRRLLKKKDIYAWLHLIKNGLQRTPSMFDRTCF